AYDVYPLDGRHDGGYYTVKDCVTIDVLPRTPGNNVYVGFMVWSNFTATKCRGLVSLNQLNVDGMNIISNDGSNKLNRSRKARVSYKVQRTINASLNAATSTRAVSSNPNFVTRQKIEIIFG